MTKFTIKRIKQLPDEVFMATLKERRNTDRQRQQKWRKRQQEQGKKQISAMISLKSQLLLNREKRRYGESTSEIIERALSALASSQQQSSS